MWFWLKTKLLQCCAGLFGGETVYIKVLGTNPEIHVKIARHMWDPFGQDPRPAIQHKNRTWQLDPDGTVGPVSDLSYNNKRKDLWKYVSKSRHVEHVLKNGR